MAKNTRTTSRKELEHRLRVAEADAAKAEKVASRITWGSGKAWTEARRVIANAKRRAARLRKKLAEI